MCEKFVALPMQLNARMQSVPVILPYQDLRGVPPFVAMMQAANSGQGDNFGGL